MALNKEQIIWRIGQLNEADKLSVLADFLSGGVDMSSDLADAMAPLSRCLDENYERLLAAVEE